jgi:hypothetical protein
MAANIYARRIRVRARARGAAMTEAVVAIPFFIILFASLVFIGKLYGEKERTIRQARELAWAQAMNCGASQSGDPLSEIAVDGKAKSETDKYKGVTGELALSTEHGMASATVTGTASASGVLGGFTRKLSTTTRLTCNEQPLDGDLKGVLKFGWKLLTNWD